MRRLLPVMLLLVGCSDDEALTGFEITVRYDVGLELDQIELSGSRAGGEQAFAPGRVPETPRPLTDGEDTIVVLLDEALGAQTLTLSASGHSGGRVVAEGEVTADVEAKSIRAVTVSLARLADDVCGDGEQTGAEACDDGNTTTGDGCSATCALEPEVDAGVGDAEPMDALPDGGPDAAPDAGPDAGPDGGPPDTGDAGIPDTGCVPEAEIVADGIDQDCDGFDDCHQDLDGDGFGTSVVVTDTDLDCSNASAQTSTTDDDCDDGDLDVFPGSTCDDGDGTTFNDLCIGPLCAGYQTAGCAASCNNCGAGDCCRRSCPGSGCPTCPVGCSCDLTCDGSSTCPFTCGTGAICHLSANSVEDVDMICQAGASCDLECNSVDNCNMVCVAGARCSISYCNSATCAIDCPSGAMSCPGGVEVCNRQCP